MKVIEQVAIYRFTPQRAHFEIAETLSLEPVCIILYFRFPPHQRRAHLSNFACIIGESETASLMEESGDLILSTGDSNNAGSLVVKAGTSDLGGHDFYGASVDIKVCVFVFVLHHLASLHDNLRLLLFYLKGGR